jgi:hypothetical protein
LPSTAAEFELLDAVFALIAGVSSVSARFWYETDAIRMRGEILLVG